MAFVRVKHRGGQAYYYLVETTRQPPEFKPRQKVLRYLGTKPPRGRQKGLRHVAN